MMSFDLNRTASEASCKSDMRNVCVLQKILMSKMEDVKN